MTNERQRKSVLPWSGQQACIVAISLLFGVLPVGYAAWAVGSLVHGAAPGASAPPSSQAATTEEQTAAPGITSATAGPQLTPEQRKAAADKQAAPMIEQLGSDPNNAALAIQIGNVYYDAQVFAPAAEYYRRSLSIDSSKSAVRIDLATALFNLGETDSALSQLNRVLQGDPNNNAALFNRGIVKWQGKEDVDGAVADWEAILRQNPNYAQADKIRATIALARKQKT